jgi:predicted AlkP superfamily pyrophosphatase or phosphodiesterase
MKRLSFLVLIVVTFLTVSPRASAQTTRPVPQVERMVIISIDGGRPDLLLRANCPSIRSLIDSGSYTFWAKTTAVAITLPSHVSMLTGVPPIKHGIMWNEDLPLKAPYWPKFPTLFEIAHNAGYTTALVSGKGKFKEFLKPGTLDWPLVTDAKDDDAVANDAARVIREHQPQILFVHFPGSDVVGHAKGWGSHEQLKEFETIDLGISRILAVLDELKLREHAVILLTADHGGAGRTHGVDDPRSRHIPWIITGPGIRQNFDLTLNPTLEVRTEDTFATACYLFGLKARADVDGKPVMDVLADRELLGSK